MSERVVPNKKQLGTRIPLLCRITHLAQWPKVPDVSVLRSRGFGCKSDLQPKFHAKGRCRS